MRGLKRFFKMNPGDQKQKGFTLIELLVVLTIIAILAGVFVIPNVMGAAEKGRVTAAITDVEALQKSIDYFVLDNEELPNRKDSSTENYYTLLYTGMASGGTPLTAVKMENKQGADQSTSGVLDTTDFPLIKRDNLYYHFVVNDRYYPAFRQYGQSGRPSYGWRESYMKLKGSLLDPWGNSYVVALKDLGNSTTRIFILSAGADKVLDTDPAVDTTINPNDLGITWIMRP